MAKRLIGLMILTAVFLLSCGRGENAPAVSETVGDCVYTLTLDKGKYSLDDTVKATVTLENKGDSPVGLYSSNSGHFLDSVAFEINGESTHMYSAPQDHAAAIMTDLLEAGEKLEYTAEFTPGAPYNSGDPAADMSAEWVIRSYLTMAPEPGDDFLEIHETEGLEKYTLEITVPH